MAGEAKTIMLNSGKDVSVGLVAGADAFLLQVLAEAPSKTGTTTLKVVKNSSGVPFVAVFIGGKHVGFLSRPDSQGLLPALAACEQQNAVAEARATLAAAPDRTAPPTLELSLASPDQLLGTPEPAVSPPVTERPEVQPEPAQFCRGCGKGLPANAKFCLECGTPVAITAAPQQGAVAAALPALPAQSAAADAPVTASPMPTPLGAAPRPTQLTRTSPASSGLTPLSGGLIAGHVVALIGSVMLLIGPFLPWASALWVSASGLQKTGNEAIVLVIVGVIGVASSVVSLFLRRRIASVPFVLGLIGLGFSVWYYVQIRDQLADPDLQDMGAAIGSGLYLCLVGAILAIAGAVVCFASRKRNR